MTRAKAPRQGQAVRVLVEVGRNDVAQISIGGELLGGAIPYPGGLRVLTVTGREIGCASGYEAAGSLLALHAGYRLGGTEVRPAARAGRALGGGR